MLVFLDQLAYDILDYQSAMCIPLSTEPFTRLHASSTHINLTQDHICQIQGWKNEGRSTPFLK